MSQKKTEKVKKDLKELIILLNDILLEEEKISLVNAYKHFIDAYNMCCNFLERDDPLMKSLDLGLAELKEFREKTGF